MTCDEPDDALLLLREEEDDVTFLSRFSSNDLACSRNFLAFSSRSCVVSSGDEEDDAARHNLRASMKLFWCLINSIGDVVLIDDSNCDEDEWRQGSLNDTDDGDRFHESTCIIRPNSKVKDIMAPWQKKALVGTIIMVDRSCCTRRKGMIAMTRRLVNDLLDFVEVKLS